MSLLSSDYREGRNTAMIAVLRRLQASPRMMALADQVIVSACNFFTTLITARLLSVEGFGQFSLALMGTLFAANLHRAVLTQPMNILGATEGPPQLAGRMLALLKSHVYAIPLATCFIAILSYHLFPSVAMFVAVLWYLAGFFLQELLRRYWYVRGQLGNAFTNDLVSYGGQLLVMLLVELIWGLNRSNVFVAMGLTSWLGFFIGLAKVDWPRPLVSPPLWQILSQHWRIARWLVLTVLAVWGAGQVYPFLIASLGPVVVATFSASRNVLNVIGILVQSFSNYLPSRAALLLKEQGKAALRRHMLVTLGQSSLASLTLLVVVWWLARPLLHLLYGGTYDHADHLLKILVVGSSCTILGSALGAYSLAMEDSRSNFLANLGATAMTFTVGLWLIREYGMEGAAIATSLSLATAMLLQAMFVMMRYRSLPAGVRHA